MTSSRTASSYSDTKHNRKPIPALFSAARRDKQGAHLPLLSNQPIPLQVQEEPKSQLIHLQGPQQCAYRMDSTKMTVSANKKAEEGKDPMVVVDGGEDPGPSTQQRYVKLGLLSALVLVIAYVVIDYTVPDLGYVDEILKGFLEWVEDNPGQGAVAFAAVYVFTTVCFIPGSLLTLGAGLVFGRALGTGFGVLVGSIAVLVGATIGSILAFLLGRFVLREQAQGLFNRFKILKAVDRAIESQGLKLVILLRLSPVVPFSAFNYVMGVTAVTFKSYALGCIGFIPGTIAYVFIGTTASSLLGDDEDEEEDSGSSESVQLIVIIVGAIATIVAVVLITIYAKRALNKVLQEGEEEEKRVQEALEVENVEAGEVVALGAVDPTSSRPIEQENPIKRES